MGVNRLVLPLCMGEVSRLLWVRVVGDLALWGGEGVEPLSAPFLPSPVLWDGPTVATLLCVVSGVFLPVSSHPWVDLILCLSVCGWAVSRAPSLRDLSVLLR